MDAAFVLQTVISGIGTGIIYGLIGIGFCVIYNASGIVNFAQGMFVMLGGMVTHALLTRAGLSPLLAIPLAVVVCAALGIAIDRLVVQPLAGAALKKLRQSGYLLVVLTNQPVIARGEASEEDVAAIHRRLEWELGKEGAFLDAIYFCPHHPDKGFVGERPELKFRCECRKPATGMFEQACKDLPADVERSWMIGDQAMDIEMARRAGLRSIRVTNGANNGWPEGSAMPDFVASDLVDAARIVLDHAVGYAAVPEKAIAE